MIRLFLILIIATICQARLNFEISLGQSSDWKSAGWTELTPDGQVLDVSNVNDVEHTSADGFVYVRLANHPNVQTSIPVPCWSGEVTLHVEDVATPVALSFPSCSKAQLTHQQEATTTITIPTSISKVYTTHPASANTITMKQVKEMFDALSSANNSGNKKASPYAQDEEDEEEAEEEEDGEGKKRRRKQPPPDDRTWLQKNWMLVLPLGLIVLNRMIAPPPPEAQGGGGGGGGGPRR